jgi:Flp pilus assembly protein TadB
VAAFLAIGLALPRASTWVVAVLALSVSVAVELSQLYHAPWIDSMRSTTVGGLLLGYGFLWSDLACYAAGVGLASLIEMIGQYAGRCASTSRQRIR